ncbi:cysteine--1-D-myo-inosityl 2-amino-2-deoxy-alpha-D-glucopyranoside ligase [Micrococcales bacterium 31B]|nr:cysteine--1-D-myo-inosityl 2-amino-2-deoxy-alpha-D-glucopyranoside ligase [Micrococcales bacterium 31B]
MKTWNSPPVPQLPTVTTSLVPSLFNTRSQSLEPTHDGLHNQVGLYVCGITPYDATHMGHASTYVAFDLLRRLWEATGLQVTHVQNVTDIDDPLLERAARDGVDWVELAREQEALFAEDMEALRVVPPTDYLGAVETIPLVVTAVQRLLAQGSAYTVETKDSTAGDDVYFDLASTPEFPFVAPYDRPTLLAFFAERGGDPLRPGKRSALDPLLWRAARAGEPDWDGDSLGPGRPGWHIECATIAEAHLSLPFNVQGGGSDLIFPHHDMSAAHIKALTGKGFASVCAHTGVVGLDGHKMSKSRGNLVFVSVLRREGVDPMAIRLTLLAQHYRSDWEWTAELLETATQRLATWRRAAAVVRGSGALVANALDTETVRSLMETLADDLNAPAAVELVDAWAARVLAGGDAGVAASDAAFTAVETPLEQALVPAAVDALLGIDL